MGSADIPATRWQRRARYKAFCARSFVDMELSTLFLDAIYLRHDRGEKEGVQVAWGYTSLGKRVLVAMRLGQRPRPSRQ